jgi:putative ABC transport system substrate-binding protein
VRRREFITLLGGAAAWPIAASGQQSAIPTIGYLGLGEPDAVPKRLTAFRNGLGELGYVEGRNLTLEFRWDHGDRRRLPELAADLVSRRASVIVAPGGANSALAAKAATSTIPIIFWTTADPVQAGLVSSLNRPGGNVTGVSSMGVEIEGKQLGLLRELLPTGGYIAVLVNPDGRFVTEFTVKQLESAAASLGQQVDFLAARSSRDIDSAFSKLVRERATGLLVTANNLFEVRRAQIVTLSARHAVPSIYWEREYTEIGGLMSYGPSTAEGDRQVGIYAGRILRGEKAGDLPVIQPTKFEFVFNLQTAKTFGLDVPAQLLARADEILE